MDTLLDLTDGLKSLSIYVGDSSSRNSSSVGSNYSTLLEGTMFLYGIEKPSLCPLVLVR
jgi:hypothetical protein